MNLTDLTRVRKEREFKYHFKSRYDLTNSIIEETLTLFFDLLKDKGDFDFSSASELEESINKYCEKKGVMFKYTMCSKLKRNYQEFFKTLFVDFAMKTSGGGSSFFDGQLSKLHFSLVSPDYIDDSYDRSNYDLSGYVDYRIGLYGNLNRTDLPNDTDICPTIKSNPLAFTDSIGDNLFVSLIRMNIGLLNPSSAKPEALALLNIDIGSNLIKGLTLEDMRTTTYRNEIFSVIINKIFLSMYTNMVYFSIVSCYDKFRNVLLNKTESISYFDIYMSLITNILSSNSVNSKFDLVSNNPELTLSSLLDSIKLNFLNKTAFNIINEGVDELRRFMVLRHFQYPVYLDSLLDKFLDTFRKKSTNVTRNKYGNLEQSNSFSTIPKNFALESTSESNMRTNPLLMSDKGFAIDNFYGMESIRESDGFDKMRRMRRMELLAKITHKERNKLLKAETEVARIKADVINCESPMLQRALLKRLNHIAKDINDLSARSSVSDAYKELMSLLESERRDIEVNLSSRDFNRERKTMLYGQIKTIREFDY